jgi:hypothetical protein
MISYDRLVAPREHLGVLIEPAPPEILDLLQRAGEAPAAREGEAPAEPRLNRITILGRPLTDWRKELRLRLGLTGPVIATGHQAEFFHAGVFAKTIAAHALARHTGGSAVYVTVDSDVGKTRRLEVPEITSRALRRVDVAVPGLDTLRADECQPDVPREQWLDFFFRVASVYEHYDASLLGPFSQGWLAGDQQIRYCDGLARGWRALEEAIGLRGVRELRISHLCGTPAFRAFSAHLILNAERLAAEYNAARAAFRVRHHVRDPARPVPPLAVGPQRVEVPLWVMECDGPRARLHVRRAGETVELFAGRQRIAVVEAARLADPASHEEPWELERLGWQLRPRALTLSGFVRLFVADLFIHGIGGAKYDEVTDEYLSRFLGAPVPPMCCVTATMYLPLPRTGVRREELAQARRRARDLIYNPQRYVRNPSPDLLRRRAELICRSQELAAHDRLSRAERRAVFMGIRAVNEHLLRQDPWRAAEFEQKIQNLRHALEQDEVALDREYFVGLHLRRSLEELIRRIDGQLVPEPAGAESRDLGV